MTSARRLGFTHGHKNNSSKNGRRLSMESLEQRLALTWAGVPPTAIAPPTGALGITLNAQNSASGAATIATTEVDYYSFTAATSGTYSISATTPTSTLDTVLGVFSSTGQRLAYNDDISYPTTTDSRVTMNLSAGQRYYVGITNYATSSRGAYSWAVAGPAAAIPPTDDAYENNDTFGTAYNLGSPSATQTVSNLVMADSADWYRFTTAATGTSSNSVSISFLNSQGNLQLALYNSSGGLVSSSQGTGNSEAVSLSGLAAGTYYVDVFGAGGVTNPNYTLTVNPPAASTPTASGFQITLNMTGLTTPEQQIFQQAASRWSQVITGDLPNATFRGVTVDDLLIDATAPTIDGVGGILGQSGPDAFRSGSLLPIHGVMEFDSADMQSMVDSGLLYSVVLHEMGHILGIGTLWSDFGLLSGAGTTNPIFTGANATAQYNQVFGTSVGGVPVEATGGAGTADSHWRETIMTNELMTGWAGPGTNLPLSRVTVGSLADLGYTVNYAAADAYTPSSTGLTAARAASTSLTGVRQFGILASETGVSSTSTHAVLAANAARTHQHHLLPTSHITPLDQDVADLVMAESAQSRLGGGQSSTSVTSANFSDNSASDHHPIEDAWDSLAADVDFWPTLANA